MSQNESKDGCAGCGCLIVIIIIVIGAWNGGNNSDNTNPVTTTSPPVRKSSNPFVGVWITDKACIEFNVKMYGGVSNQMPYLVLNSDGTGQQGTFVYVIGSKNTVADAYARVKTKENVTWKKTWGGDLVVTDSAKRTKKYLSNGLSIVPVSETHDGRRRLLLHHDTKLLLGLTCY